MDISLLLPYPPAPVDDFLGKLLGSGKAFPQNWELHATFRLVVHLGYPLTIYFSLLRKTVSEIVVLLF